MPHAFNPHPKHPAVAYLLRLHADLGGQLLANKREAKRLRANMKHVEAVVRLFDPAHDVRPVAVRRRKKNPWFKRGTIFRAVLDVLRAAEGPLTTPDICRRLLAQRRATATSAQFYDLCCAVRSSLRNHDGKTVERSEGIPARWRLLH